MAGDQLNVSLEDVDLLIEVEMTTNLMIAASQSIGRVPATEVDRLLGVEPRPGQRERRVPLQLPR
jgi:hypothetical protein